MEARSSDGVGMGQNMRMSDIVIDDANLSMAAKGVFSTLGFLGNTCSLEHLLERTRDDEKSLWAALNELTAAGYVQVEERTVRVPSTGSFGVT